MGRFKGWNASTLGRAIEKINELGEKYEASDRLHDIINPVQTTVDFGAFRIAGLNGADGLMRLHWTKRKKLKESLCVLIKQQTRHRHAGTVKVYWVRYTTKPMDWDNHCASAKHVLDALVDCRVITDDKPAVVKEFVPVQHHVKKRAEERCVVIIKDLITNK